MAAQTVLPRWRGFTVLEMFSSDRRADWRENDFRWMSDWGFDFVRVPMNYRFWVEGDDWYQIHEPGLEMVDRVVELGRRHGIHVNLNFHDAPGWSVNRRIKERANLWKDQEALDAFCHHWKLFVERYKGIPSSELSFNLTNEPNINPPESSREDHERVIRIAVAEIREVDPERLLIEDGVETVWESLACPELADAGIAQSCRAYSPKEITHYEAPWSEWMARGGWVKPQWPGLVDKDGKTWNREALEEYYQQWVDLANQGVGVHCGEMGCYSETPHGVVLAWMRDVLEILTAHNIGYALWNLRGSFGVLDSNRKDVEYEDFHGHKLDRKMLSLLQGF